MRIKRWNKEEIYLGLAVLVVASAISWQRPLLCQEPGHDIVEIMTKMDELYRSESSYSEVEMKIITPNWQRTLEMKIWTQGLEKTLIRILSPKKEKGMGTLRIGNEMWNYLPKTNKVMKIPPSMMMGSWMGSDFTNDDLVEEFTYIDDYTYEWAEVENPEKDVLYIKAIPREDLPVVWGHLVMAIRGAEYIPLWEKYYDEKGRLIRTMTFSEVQQFGKRLLPATMMVIPANKEGHSTSVRYTSATFDQSIEDNVFSLRNLRSPK
jgi:outer membrane lipoprotein-sorting protein